MCVLGVFVCVSVNVQGKICSPRIVVYVRKDIKICFSASVCEYLRGSLHKRVACVYIQVYVCAYLRECLYKCLCVLVC